MRKDPVFWLSIVLAFVVGSTPGVVLWLNGRSAGGASGDARIGALQAGFDAEKRALSDSLASAEASAAALDARIATLTAEIAALKQAPKPPPAAKPKPAGPPPVIEERSVDSSGKIEPNTPITLVVKVRGEADRVTMKVVRKGVAGGWTKTYSLKEASSVGDVHTWKKAVAAPPEVGEYRFYADAYLGDAHVTMPGVSAWLFAVE